MNKKKWVFLTVVCLIFAFTLIAPYPKLFTLGNTSCDLCVGDCWEAIDGACETMYPDVGGGFFHVDTFTIVTAYCYNSHCEMVIIVYCQETDEGDDPVSYRSMWIGCTAYNCWDCNPS
jgi:hypothetical protein